METPLDRSKDFLTGCYTRETLGKEVNKLILGYETYQKAFSVILLDIDHFKSFNDKFGHLLGDEVLKYFSSSIRLDLVAEVTTLFRFGGDEFLILAHAADSDQAYTLTLRTLENMKQRPCNLRGNHLKMSFSAGIASYPADGQTVEQLLEQADKALYSSKRSGRGHVTQYHKIWLKKLRLAGFFGVLFLIAVLIVILVQINFKQKISLVTQKGISAVGKFETVFSRSLDRAKALVRSANLMPNPVAPKELSSLVPATPPKPIPTPSTVPAPPLLPPAPPPPPLDAVYLKSGGVIRGHIIAEDTTRLTVELEVSSGHGTVGIAKRDVVKIEKQP